MKIILFNAPPLSGKSTIAKLLVEELHEEMITARQESMAGDLGQMVWQIVQPWAHAAGYTYQALRHTHKDKSLKELIDFPLDHTFRTLMIAFKEVNFNGLFLPDDFLTRRTIMALRDYEGLVQATVFDDLGFPYEARIVIEAFGRKNVCIIHLHREGTSWTGDSRNWVYPKEPIGLFITQDNNDTPRDTVYRLRCLISPWLSGSHSQADLETQS